MRRIKTRMRVFIRERSQHFSMQSVDEKGHHPVWEERKRSKTVENERFWNFPSKATWFVNGCLQRPRRTGSAVSLIPAESGLVTEPGGPTQPGCRCGWKTQRPHPEAGETSKCGVWSAGQQGRSGAERISHRHPRLGPW